MEDAVLVTQHPTQAPTMELPREAMEAQRLRTVGLPLQLHQLPHLQLARDLERHQELSLLQAYVHQMLSVHPAAVVSRVGSVPRLYPLRNGMVDVDLEMLSPMLALAQARLLLKLSQRTDKLLRHL